METQGDLAEVARKLRSPVSALPQQVEASAMLKVIMAPFMHCEPKAPGVEPPEKKMRTIAPGAEPPKKKIHLVMRTPGASPIR